MRPMWPRSCWSRTAFSRDSDGKWLLPDGTPWKIACLSDTIAVNHDARNCAAAVQAWKKFGIDASSYMSEAYASLNSPATSMSPATGLLRSLGALVRTSIACSTTTTPSM